MDNYKKVLEQIKSGKVTKKYFCENCGWIESNDTQIRAIDVTHCIKNNSITINGDVRFCKHCGIQISDTELDDKILVCAYNKYRKNNGLLLPNEIKDIRNKYALTARQFAKLLNFGDHNIYNYELGVLQSKSIDTAIRNIVNPENLLRYIANTKTKLSDGEIEKLQTICIRELYSAIQNYMPIVVNIEVYSANIICCA